MATPTVGLTDDQALTLARGLQRDRCAGCDSELTGTDCCDQQACPTCDHGIGWGTSAGGMQGYGHTGWTETCPPTVATLRARCPHPRCGDGLHFTGQTDPFTGEDIEEGPCTAVAA